MRGFCQKSPYLPYPIPNPINPLPFFTRKLPAPPPARATLPLSRRTGGSLGRRSVAAAGADGAGATRSQIPYGGRLPRGCEVEPGARPDGPGAGRSTRTGPGDGRCHPCPPRADGPLVKSEAQGLGTWKPVRAERLTFAETLFPTVSGRTPGAPPTPLTAREIRAGLPCGCWLEECPEMPPKAVVILRQAALARRRPGDPAARSRQRSRNLSPALYLNRSRYRAPLGPPVPATPRRRMTTAGGTYP